MLEKIRKAIRQRVMRWAAKDVLLFVTAEEVLRVSEGHVFAGGRELRPDELKRLMEEAKFFKSSTLLNYIVRLIAYGTQERVLREGADEYDLWTARAARLMSTQLFQALDDIANMADTETAKGLTG